MGVKRIRYNARRKYASDEKKLRARYKKQGKRWPF